MKKLCLSLLAFISLTFSSYAGVATTYRCEGSAGQGEYTVVTEVKSTNSGFDAFVALTIESEDDPVPRESWLDLKTNEVKKGVLTLEFSSEFDNEFLLTVTLDMYKRRVIASLEWVDMGVRFEDMKCALID